jgi:hypothetical protein
MLNGLAWSRPDRTASRTTISEAPVRTAASSAVTHSGIVGTDALMRVIGFSRKV